MYNKLFTSILDSSIWLEPSTTRVVWITLLAAMNEEGFVRMATVKNLAIRSHVTEKECLDAVTTLESPDKSCPEQAREGRRIERVDGGWLVLNAGKYREIVNREHEKEMNRIRVARCREKKKRNGVVIGGNEKLTQSEAEADGTTNKQRPRNLQEVLGAAAMVGCPPEEAERFWHHFEASGWITKNGQPIAKWQSKLASWAVDSRSRQAEKVHHAQETVRAEPSAGAAMVRDQKELERVEKKIAEIKNSYEAHHDVSEFDRQTLSKLNARKKELTGKLGFTV